MGFLADDKHFAASCANDVSNIQMPVAGDSGVLRYPVSIKVENLGIDDESGQA